MAIITLVDQNELDQLNTFLDDVTPGWIVETELTPIDLGRPDKKYCLVKKYLTFVTEYLDKRGQLDGNLLTFINSLEFAEYNYPVTSNVQKVMSTYTRLDSAPIGSWRFVLEGQSISGGKFMTNATKIAIPSNLCPAVLPANLHVVSITWSNEIDGANEEVRFYNNGNLTYTWTINNARWAVINAQSAFEPLFVLPERSYLSAEIVNINNPAAKDGIINIFFRMAGDPLPGLFTSPTL